MSMWLFSAAKLSAVRPCHAMSGWVWHVLAGMKMCQGCLRYNENRLASCCCSMLTKKSSGHECHKSSVRAQHLPQWVAQGGAWRDSAQHSVSKRMLCL